MLSGYAVILRLKKLESFGTVLRLVQFVALMPQKQRENIARAWLILSNENSFRPTKALVSMAFGSTITLFRADERDAHEQEANARPKHF